jgi:uncharacterized membrane protein YqjE
MKLLPNRPSKEDEYRGHALKTAVYGVFFLFVCAFIAQRPDDRWVAAGIATALLLISAVFYKLWRDA